MATIVGETSNLSGDYADNYMKRAINKVDAAFGKGCAIKHPELVAAFMQTAALAMLAGATQYAGETIAEALDGLHEPLRSDHPLQGQTFSGLEGALQDIAEAQQGIATQLRYLGNGDAATTMGAIEHLATHLGNKLETLAAYVGEGLEILAGSVSDGNDDAAKSRSHRDSNDGSRTMT